MHWIGRSDPQPWYRIEEQFANSRAVFLGFGQTMYLAVPKSVKGSGGKGWWQIDTGRWWRAQSQALDTEGYIPYGTLVELRGLTEAQVDRLRVAMVCLERMRFVSRTRLVARILAGAGFVSSGGPLLGVYSQARLYRLLTHHELSLDDHPVDIRIGRTGLSMK